MYEAKAANKNCVRFATATNKPPEPPPANDSALELENDASQLPTPMSVPRSDSEESDVRS